MSVIDNLQILITADSRGIESVLKNTLQKVQGTVNAINKQEVDWTSIFTQSVSPAIISGIASVFAFAISNAVQFQSSLNQLGTAAGDNTSQIGQLSNAALGLSTQVPASAQDIATAMTELSSVFSSTADQQAVVQAMAMLAASGFGSLNDITNASIAIFKAWGVTTQEQAITVLTNLMHGAEAAKESIPALAEQFNQFSAPLVEAGANLSSFNGIISVFASEVKNLGTGAAEGIFKALADSSNNAVGPMELLGISLSKVRNSLISDGGLDAITKTSQILDKMGPTANLVATGFGFSAQQIAQFDINSKRLPQVATDASTVAKNTQTIGDAWKTSNNDLRILLTTWNTFVAASITGAADFIKAWTGVVHFLQTVADTISNVLFNQTVTGIGKIIGSANSLVDQAEHAAVSAVQSIVNPQLNAKEDSLNKLLQGTGVNLGAGSLARIDSAAESSGLVDALIQALQSGVGGGSSSYAQLHNTFNLNVPAGPGVVLTAKAIAAQLYKQFQGSN